MKVRRTNHRDMYFDSIEWPTMHNSLALVFKTWDYEKRIEKQVRVYVREYGLRNLYLRISEALRHQMNHIESLRRLFGG